MEQQEIKILSIFNLSNDLLMVIVDSYIELNIGDYLTNSTGLKKFLITGKVLHIKRSNSVPVKYLKNNKLKISVSLKPLVADTGIDINDVLYITKLNTPQLPHGQCH